MTLLKLVLLFLNLKLNIILKFIACHVHDPWWAGSKSGKEKNIEASNGIKSFDDRQYLDRITNAFYIPWMQYVWLLTSDSRKINATPQMDAMFTSAIFPILTTSTTFKHAVEHILCGSMAGLLMCWNVSSEKKREETTYFNKMSRVVWTVWSA